MLGIRYMKAAPTTYVQHSVGGKIRREGMGLSFFYFSPPSTIVAVPLASSDVPFVFAEMTGDFQAVTLQGQVSYRVVDPKKLAGLLDYSYEPGTGWLTDDRDVPPQRLVQETQVLAHALIGHMKLREALVSSEQTGVRILQTLRQSKTAELLGVEIIGLTLLEIKPAPEMARALEAEAREDLQKKADEAIYARRIGAVEQERLIKESELNTEIAVEDKKREVRETQMKADIAVEQKRVELLERKIANDRKEAESRRFALESFLEPISKVDWKTLVAASGKTDSRMMIAMAFRELAENAQKVGNLNISPDLLDTLLSKER